MKPHTYSDNTFLSMTKEELIQYIRTIELNWAVAEETVEQQAKNFIELEKTAQREAAKDIILGIAKLYGIKE